MPNNDTLPSVNDSTEKTLTKILRRLNSNVGINGGSEFSDTSAHTGDWTQLYAKEDSVFSAITSNVEDLAQDTALAAGDRLYGAITGFTLASGTVIAYN